MVGPPASSVSQLKRWIKMVELDPCARVGEPPLYPRRAGGASRGPCSHVARQLGPMAQPLTQARPCLHRPPACRDVQPASVRERIAAGSISSVAAVRRLLTAGRFRPGSLGGGCAEDTRARPSFRLRDNQRPPAVMVTEGPFALGSMHHSSRNQGLSLPSGARGGPAAARPRCGAGVRPFGYQWLPPTPRVPRFAVEPAMRRAS
jgi:hypothetical protein